MAARDDILLALAGDVMLGRGIDQILPRPSGPRIYEGYLDSALDYVHLAEAAHGPIPRGVPFAHVWGDALDDLREARPQARIVNLETSVTTSDAPVPKGINYRMHPGNVGCLTAAAIDCCVLANNHVLDWGPAGLADTLATLEGAGIATAGAGRDDREAARPAILGLEPDGRILVFGYGSATSGIPPDWVAAPRRPGVRLLRDLSPATAAEIAREVLALRRPGDIVVASIHWGSNWGYQVGSDQRAFARALVEAGACDVLHGHSSHHFRPIEVHCGRPILYGCGDFINDYEGIGGYERFRGDLALLYLPRLSRDGALSELGMLPYRIRRFRLERAAPEEAAWMQAMLDRESRPFGCRIALDDGRLAAHWR